MVVYTCIPVYLSAIQKLLSERWEKYTCIYLDFLNNIDNNNCFFLELKVLPKNLSYIEYSIILSNTDIHDCIMLIGVYLFI